MESVNNINFYNGQYASTVYSIAEEEPEYTFTMHKISRPPSDPYPTPVGDSIVLIVFVIAFILCKMF